MQRTKPPFRADHVGSLLRPAALKDARARHAKKEITDAQLKEIEDREIEKVDQEAGRDRAQARDRRRIPPLLVAFRFLQGPRWGRALRTERGHPVRRRRHQGRERPRDRQGRLLRPSASRALQVSEGAHQGHAEDDHPGAVDAALPAGPPVDQQGHLSGSRRLFRRCRRSPISKAIRAFYDAGCRYLQLDDTAWSMICDPKRARRLAQARRRSRQAAARLHAPHQRGAGRKARRHGDHHAFLPRQLPLDLHRLRRLRVRRRGAVRQGQHRRLFPRIRHRARRRLRAAAHLPKGNKIVVLGLVTSKSGRLEPKDDIKRRIDEAAKYVPLERLCLSPQCGFASTEEGNVLAEDEQWAKLRMIVELADEVVGVTAEWQTNQTAVSAPITSGRLLRPARAERRARQARTRRDHRRATQGDRRPRDRRGHQEAGRHRPPGRHRRRIPPRLLAFRFPRAARRRRSLSRRAQGSSSRARSPSRMMLRVIGKLGVLRPSDARALPAS